MAVILTTGMRPGQPSAMALNVNVLDLALAGTAITAAYQFGQAIGADRAKKVRAVAVVTTIAGTNATSAQVKLQGSIDGANWFDLSTLDGTAAAPAATVDQSKAIAGAAVTAFDVSYAQGFAWVRAAARFTGGIGKAGESIAVNILLA